MAIPPDQLGARVGALVGAVGGLAFVLVNGSSAGGLALPLRVLAVVLFAVVVVLVVRADRLGAGGDRTPQQMRAYWWIVIAEVVAIPVGSHLLVRVAGIDDAALPWVTIVLGVHFIGFARIFPGAGFLVLGATTALLGVVGLGLAIGGASSDAVAVVAGVVTGFVVLLAVLRGVLLRRSGARGATS